MKKPNHGYGIVQKVKWKYAGIYCVIIIFTLVFAGAIVFKFSSDYNISNRENGFPIEVDRLNKIVTKEFELKKGDTVKASHQGNSGSWYVRIGKDEENPIFYGNTYDEFENFSVEIQKDSRIANYIKVCYIIFIITQCEVSYGYSKNHKRIKRKYRDVPQRVF